jgi:hypothetical protein
MPIAQDGRFRQPGSHEYKLDCGDGGAWFVTAPESGERVAVKEYIADLE